MYRLRVERGRAADTHLNQHHGAKEGRERKRECQGRECPDKERLRYVRRLRTRLRIPGEAACRTAVLWLVVWYHFC